MNNYSQVLTQMQVQGLQVDTLEIDGRVHRCRVEGSKERKGWYLLHIWRASSGLEYVVGSFGVWQGSNNNVIKVELSTDVLMTDADKSALKARLSEDRKRAAAQREHEAGRAARRAATVWAKALKAPPPGKPLDYLQRKGVQSYGLRYTETGALVIPMMDARGDTKGLQFILPADHPRVKQTHRDKEYWPKGLSKQGHWFQIGSAYSGGIVLVAEGYATAASLHAATGLPVAVAFDAGNLLHVAQALKKSRRVERILICADDDYLQRCTACKKATPVAEAKCIHCGADHTNINPGTAAAAAAALAVGGSWLAPVFPADRQGKKLTDFNDLQQFPQGGLPLVRAQIEAKLSELGWALPAGATRLAVTEGEGGDTAMAARISVDEAVLRYVGTYGMGGKVLFDAQERRLIHKDDVMNLLPSHGWDLLKSHPQWRVVRDHEIGFDPTEIDKAVKCNLYGGWPTQPKPGTCTALLDLLMYLCGNEANREEVYQWMLRWLAYPIQHPGAKMHSAIVVHGPQGTGKSRFFEAYGKIFGPYGRVLGQEALEDKFNADWAEKKLFILADEVLARQDMFHIKNRLKGFITGDTIRVNPKNIAAHNEKNQMNIVFLSNERMPLVLENDDRRHCVIWVPPKLSDDFFAEVNAEIEGGGIEALHHYLLNLDLKDFKPWTRPPMTGAKQDLIQQSLSSEDRFIADWMNLEIEGPDGDPLPFCPCLGSHLYRAYEVWCNSAGERARRMQEVIGLVGKKSGWQAGKPQHTWTNLQDPTDKIRKLIVPSDTDMADAAARDKSHAKTQTRLLRERFDTKAAWMTACFFAFETAMGTSIRNDK
jgi:putative DNA primase/helicase